MMYSQLVLVPLLLVFSWGYIALRPASGRGAAMMLFDIGVLALAVILSLAGHWWISGLEIESIHSVWVTVMATISTFHIFPAVLLAGWYLRRLLF